jgi:pSer/pThr/pTyr-binding forkhead associated (FHA) protein
VATIFKLIIEDDEGKTTVYPLAEGDISIGRKEGNTIRLMERNVSRRHARLVRANGAIFIEDLDSYNGIRINGERISGRYEVKEGDLVEIGDYHLALQRQEIEDAADDMARKPDGWPAVGTVPDFRLPDEILADGPPQDPQVSTRDTIVDQPAPADLPTAIAQTIPAESTHVVHHKDQKHGPQLPPFPTPQSPPPARVPFFSGAAAPAAKPGDEEPTKSLSVGPSRVAAVPRLICVSTNYSGREFALTRPELIIGRVEDNDIVIEHRSVSRNHAKILYDGRTHKIIDLQSANGILVNGEEYAMTDLRKGDLIELGHVRFRFVPAGEDFAPTDEESREMREAGVEPPSAQRDSAPMKAVDVPSDVGGYDPSTAATVTDTPLSALNMNEVFAPKVEVAKPAAQPRRRESHPPKNGASPKRATEDERPTEINHVSRSAAPAAPTAPMSAAMPVSDAMELEYTKPQAALSLSDEARPRGRSMGVILIGVVVLGVVAAVAFTMLGGPDDQNDKILDQLYQEKKWEQANDFCEKKPTFADPVRSWQRCGEVKALARPQSKTVESPTKTAELQPEGEEPDPAIAELDSGAEEPAADPPPVKAKRSAPRRTQPKRNDPGPAALNSSAFKALGSGRLGDAKDMLLECVEKYPNAADCHRSLGSIYANLDDTAQSIQHYKRYLALRPNAKDAARVRKMIRDVEGDTPQ